MKRFLLALCLSLGLCGCASSLDKTGAYSGDLALYKADLTTQTAYDALNAFVSWEYANRAALFAKNPQIKAQADYIRVHAPGWFRTEGAIRAAYIAAPSPDKLESLQSVLVEIQTALSAASQYLTQSTSP